jgi:hypothetical protein
MIPVSGNNSKDLTSSKGQLPYDSCFNFRITIYLLINTMKTKVLLSAFSFIIALILLLPDIASTQGTWTQKSDFPGSARYTPATFSIGTKGYIGTGTSSSTDAFYLDFWELV